uniref:Uncharacterized protein n=1 Tax=Peronospora matthiolae TaxID=2874970 RepID=A0AAV1VB73_9STRA
MPVWGTSGDRYDFLMSTTTQLRHSDKCLQRAGIPTRSPETGVVNTIGRSRLKEEDYFCTWRASCGARSTTSRGVEHVDRVSNILYPGTAKLVL